MQTITKLKLAAVHQICDAQDKSTEFMYQLMQDSCSVDLDTVNAYFMLNDSEKTKLFNQVNELTQLMINISEI